MIIKKGDTVKIISGNAKGKTGEVIAVEPQSMRIVVKGVNLAKKHLKASKTSPHGGIIDKVLPIPASNAQLVCPSCGKPTRVGIDKTNTSYARMCKKCKKSI